MNQQTDSLIFDLDGTLWDATATVARAWEAARKQVDFEIQEITQEDIRSVAGMQHDLIYNKFFPDLTEAQKKELMEISGREEMQHLQKYGGKLFSGIKDSLEYLHDKYKLFIVSNCQDGYIEAFYEFNNMAYLFKDHECSGRTGNPKGENLKDIIKRNKLQQPVYVGDTKGDYQASVVAGVPFIFAGYGFGHVPTYSAYLQSPSDLQKLF
ncbi:HAD family hydrolase [Pontibacter sp. KCTC 32443]|uniref:HAD family hydrolase n=1 Tax=Pontibacter TaxID=323449 RepID=UPI00164D7A2C|nr:MULTISPECIES: HAD family hydrolase [Pontibacter]MBC5772849.1 HAD family hydrolase [Pontibacter sp. KCTC 32443]